MIISIAGEISSLQLTLQDEFDSESEVVGQPPKADKWSGGFKHDVKVGEFKM